MVIRLFFFFGFAILFGSCKKPSDRSCYKTTGSIINKIIPLGSFSQINLGPYIQYELIQDTLNFIEISSGENLINFISSDIEGGTLIIKNNNKCRFLRYRKEKVTVKIHFSELNSIFYHGSEPLISLDTLDFSQKNISIVLDDGSGSIDLKIKANNISLSSPGGFSDITLAGSCSFFRVEFEGNSSFFSKNLYVKDSIHLFYHSFLYSELRSNNCKLKAELSGIGDVGYFGIPSLILTNYYNSGRLIDKN